MMIPPSNYSKIKFVDFDITIKEHRDKLWFGCVELLFRCSFRVSDSGPEPPEEEGEILQCDLALIRSVRLQMSFGKEQHADDGWGAFVVRAQYSVDCCYAHHPYPWQGASDEDLFGGIKRFHHPILLITIQGQIL